MEANNYSEIITRSASHGKTAKHWNHAKPLNCDSALVPNLLMSQILKHCAVTIAPLLHALILLFLHYWYYHKCVWCTGWYSFTKKQVYDARTYKGIHLTAQNKNKLRKKTLHHCSTTLFDNINLRTCQNDMLELHWHTLLQLGFRRCLLHRCSGCAS